MHANEIRYAAFSIKREFYLWVIGSRCRSHTLITLKGNVNLKTYLPDTVTAFQSIINLVDGYNINMS